MTPLRIKLSGFLSYKEPQEMRFENGGIWVLAGPNGSGKSAVFDAMTYALFHSHRGGSTTSVDLINTDSSTAQIEFDFAIGADEYRIKRSIKRSKTGTGSGTQQLSKRLGDDWQPVPDTTRKTDFDKWIHDHIGLTYETFTSSVVLLQGRAEKLLDSKPAARAEVLAGIVDLERIRKLHEIARERKLEKKSYADAAKSELAQIDVVLPDEITEAADRVAAAKRARVSAGDSVENLLRVESQVRAWAEANVRLAAAKERLRLAEVTLKQAVDIEQKHQRWQDLKSILPSLKLIVTEKASIVDSQKKAATLTAEQTQLKKTRDQRTLQVSTTKTKRDELKANLANEETAYEKTRNELERLTAMMAIIRQLDDAESQKVRIENELQSLPHDADKRLHESQVEFDRIKHLKTLLPLIERTWQDQNSLPVIEKQIHDASSSEARLREDGEKAKAKFEALQKQSQDAGEAKAKAQSGLATAEAKRQHAAERLRVIENQKENSACDACGQPMTKDHFKKEHAARVVELADAESTVKEAKQLFDMAVRREAELQSHIAEIQTQLEEFRTRWKDAAAAKKSFTSEQDRIRKSIDALAKDVPEEYRNLDAERLSHFKRDVDRLGDLKRTVDEAKHRADRAQALAVELNITKTKAQQLTLQLNNADPVMLQGQFHNHKTTSLALSNTIRSLKLEVESVDRQLDVLSREVHDTNIRLSDLSGKLASESRSREQSQSIIDRTISSVPASWKSIVVTAGMAEASQLEGERHELESQGIEAKYRELNVARGGLESMRGDVLRVENEVASYPAEVRRNPEELKKEIQIVRLAMQDREQDVLTAERAHAELVRRHADREAKDARSRKLDRELEIAKRLDDWLGRDYLQRYLVRTAEREILDHSNQILDRLSNGTMLLSLVQGSNDGDDTAFDLLCTNRITSTTIPVTFLSGGQRFRVAISLALGIGQYASRTHRPIESVIIDEGFGSLDRGGRQTVIQELHNLRGLLRSILLVSHQEEFAEAFSQGYSFALVNSATQVTRRG